MSVQFEDGIGKASRQPRTTSRRLVQLSLRTDPTAKNRIPRARMILYRAFHTTRIAT